MIETEPRLDAGGEDCIDEPIVEGQPFFIGQSAARRRNARPSRRETISPNTEVLHQGDVLEVAVIMVARDIAGIAIGDLAGSAAPSIPYAGAAAIFLRSSLDLITRCRNAPDKSRGEIEGPTSVGRYHKNKLQS